MKFQCVDVETGTLLKVYKDLGKCTCVWGVTCKK